jgi:hypothetical protein
VEDAAATAQDLPAGLDPQAQVFPAGFWFSVLARSQVHCPAGRARQEQRAPSTAFSDDALSHVQWRADCLPHEQVACLAQTHSALLPQQVDAFVTSAMAARFAWLASRLLQN